MSGGSSPKGGPQASKPRQGQPRPRRLNARRPVAELARAIGREVVEFKDEPGTLFEVAGTYSRIERLLRILWDQALRGNMPAIRCLLEYMEGRPATQAPQLTKEEIDNLSADVLERLLAGARARLEEAREEAWNQEPGPGGQLKLLSAAPEAGHDEGAGAAPTSSEKSG